MSKEAVLATKESAVDGGEGASPKSRSNANSAAGLKLSAQSALEALALKKSRTTARLRRAIAQSDETALLAALADGADPTASSSSSNALTDAVAAGRADFIEMLVSSLATSPASSADRATIGSAIQFSLRLAVSKQSPRSVEALLSHPFAWKALIPEGKNSVLSQMEGLDFVSQPDGLRVFVSLARTQKIVKLGKTQLRNFAVKAIEMDDAKALVEIGGTWSLPELDIATFAKNEPPLLHLAAMVESVDCVQTLLAHGCDAKRRDWNGDCALTEMGSGPKGAACFQTLLPHSDVNAQDDQGDTALHEAVAEDDLEKIQWLAKAGADFNRQNCYGLTPLMRAVELGHAEAVYALIPFSDASVCDENGQNAFDMAVEDEKWAWVESMGIAAGPAGAERAIFALAKSMMPKATEIAEAAAQRRELQEAMRKGENAASLNKPNSTPAGVKAKPRRRL